MTAVSAMRPVFDGERTVPSRLADDVVERIAAALLDGRIEPDAPLPSEGEIAREFGVSKPIAREALRQLAGVGLVATRQGRVARARALNGDSLDRFYGFAVRASLTHLREANEMRMVVETGIARLAARRRADEGVAAMAAAVADMERAILKPAAFTDADIAFHLGLALATRNSMIRVQMEGLKSVQVGVSALFAQRASRTKQDWLGTIERHRRIHDAVAAGDESEAARCIAAHYQAADIASLEVARDVEPQRPTRRRARA
ncbi:MAG: FadR/GntR family transcriptional regulator [Lautropia sp.]